MLMDSIFTIEIEKGHITPLEVRARSLYVALPVNLYLI